MCQPLVQTCAGTSLRGEGDGGWEKISQRLRGLMSRRREDAFFDSDEKSRWNLRTSSDLELFMSLDLVRPLTLV